VLLSSKEKICILPPFYVFVHEFNDSNKLKLVGVYHNTITHEQLSHAKHLKEVANNFFNVHMEYQLMCA
jgi:hypothetical protein